jgi:CheY-like chemotaxis protein
MASIRLEALPRVPPRRRSPAASQDRDDDPRQWSPGLFGQRPERQPGRLPSNLVGLTVVVVDDDPDALEVFQASLMACGATVATARTAAEALQLVSTRRPHVVLSDIAMAEGDGYWLVREIRALTDETLNRLPVVAATAFGQEHSRDRVLSAGFVEHLQKPIDPEVLCRTVARAAGR